ncbi:MAG: putative transporter [Tannerellaceae bacterium]|nr:putative transporter [Tannerellaceae bacterium]
MNWLTSLLTNPDSIPHAILLLAITIALGSQLGKLKLASVSIGLTAILFTAIALAHFGLSANPHTLHLLRDFGLILFVFAVGLQVGPAFFVSFKHGGLTLNLLAAAVVALGAAAALAIYFLTDLPIYTVVGIMSGAVTNTPGLGAAQQAFADSTGSLHPDIALGYAVAYPLGVAGIILSILALKLAFRISLPNESQRIHDLESKHSHTPTTLSLLITNPAVAGLSIAHIATLLPHTPFVVSRVLRNSLHLDQPPAELLVDGDTTLLLDDKILLVADELDLNILTTFFGQPIPMSNEDWMSRPASQLVSRRIVVTHPHLNGKRLGDLHLRSLLHVNITRINRSGIDMVAMRSLPLQLGDRLTVVGNAADVDKAASTLGNALHRLNEPNLIAIFLGIALGVLLGSIPFHLPAIPQPVKLGLAGGPLIVAILLSAFGYKYKLITYSTQSALLLLRELGISIFLAAVGLEAGASFVDTLLYHNGFTWIAYGFAITTLPLLIVGAVARHFLHLNFFSLMGLLAGATTDPPALAFANDYAASLSHPSHPSSDPAPTHAASIPPTAYATVYPLTMFLRVLVAQLLIIFFLNH